jgi:tripartite-type tricarboxylate transporter receptor subunit TctC
MPTKIMPTNERKGGHAAAKPQSGSRSVLLSAIAAIGLVSAALGSAIAQPYPVRPIRLIVPFAPGGTIDTVARLVAQPLSANLGQNVFVDNRAGAGTTIALKLAASAQPDGYTIMLGSTASLAINPALYRNLDFDSAKSLTPVAMLATLPIMLVIASAVPAKSVAELIAYAKANPGKLSHGASHGTPPHLLGEFFRARTGTDIVYVPYKSTAAAMTDLLGGQIQITAESLGVLLPHIRQGTIRPLLVTSTARLPELPDVPTLTELGLDGFPPDTWSGIVAPAGTPKDIVNKLGMAINEVLKSPALHASLTQLGFEPKIVSPDDFAARAAADAEKWAAVVKLTGAVGE